MECHKNAIYEITHHHDDGSNKLLCNVGQYLTDYIVQNPRKQLSLSDVTYSGSVHYLPSG